MIKFPFFNTQEFNLDWVMLKLKEILKFMPLNGSTGDILQRTPDGASWESVSVLSMDIHGLNSTTPAANDELPLYDVSASANRKVTVADIQSGITAPVTSVNTKTGAVVLDKTDIGLGNVANVAQYSASNPPPYPVTSVNGQTGDVVVQGGGGSAVTSVNGQTGDVTIDKSSVGLGNVANVAQYSASNPPPYPVTSVNGQTGAVTIPTSASVNMLFGNEVSCNLAAPTGITLITHTIHACKTADGKFLRVYGTIRNYKVSDTDLIGWHDFTVTGITITPPASTVTLNNAGICIYSYNGQYDTLKRDEYSYARITVGTDGSIKIGLNIDYGVAQLDNWIIFPFIIPLA